MGDDELAHAGEHGALSGGVSVHPSSFHETRRGPQPTPLGCTQQYQQNGRPAYRLPTRGPEPPGRRRWPVRNFRSGQVAAAQRVGGRSGAGLGGAASRRAEEAPLEPRRQRLGQARRAGDDDRAVGDLVGPRVDAAEHPRQRRRRARHDEVGVVAGVLHADRHLAPVDHQPDRACAPARCARTRRRPARSAASRARRGGASTTSASWRRCRGAAARCRATAPTSARAP